MSKNKSSLGPSPAKQLCALVGTRPQLGNSMGGDYVVRTTKVNIGVYYDSIDFKMKKIPLDTVEKVYEDVMNDDNFTNYRVFYKGRPAEEDFNNLYNLDEPTRRLEILNDEDYVAKLKRYLDSGCRQKECPEGVEVISKVYPAEDYDTLGQPTQFIIRIFDDVYSISGKFDSWCCDTEFATFHDILRMKQVKLVTETVEVYKEV